MISNSPVERGASNPEPMCLTENVWGDKDIRNAAFDRAPGSTWGAGSMRLRASHLMAKVPFAARIKGMKVFITKQGLGHASGNPIQQSCPDAWEASADHSGAPATCT